MAAKEDLIYKSLEIDPSRVRWCKKVNENLIKTINKKKPKTLEQLADVWYSGYGVKNRNRHYHTSRYHGLNLHSTFTKGTIEELGTKYNIKEIAFDRWGAVQMVQNLGRMGFTVVPFGQGYKDISPPSKELMKITFEKKIVHGGNPVFRWMMDNIYVKTDPTGNIKPDKEKSTEKIDGAVALIMALNRAIRN